MGGRVSKKTVVLRNQLYVLNRCYYDFITIYFNKKYDCAMVLVIATNKRSNANFICFPLHRNVFPAPQNKRVSSFRLVSLPSYFLYSGGRSRKCINALAPVQTSVHLIFDLQLVLLVKTGEEH